jgi:hypothetical protein
MNGDGSSVSRYFQTGEVCVLWAIEILLNL